MATSIRISDPVSGASAEIAPELGFNCISFIARIDGQSIAVIDSPADVLEGTHRPSSYGIPILFPFPNRIRGGKFEFDGKSYAIPLGAGRTVAIHGFCYDRPWRVTGQTEDSLTGTFQFSVDDPARASSWPADAKFEVTYRVVQNRLECRFKITNCDDTPLPWGLGTHAYFKLPFGASSQPRDCVATLPVTHQWELDNELIPTGQRTPVPESDSLRTGARFGEKQFDNVYGGWQPDGTTLQSSIVDERAGIELTQTCDAEYFREAVVFTPPNRNAMCIEPYTCVTDAVNLHARGIDSGLRILPAGKTVETWVNVQVSRVRR